jgi:hypothetical protein
MSEKYPTSVLSEALSEAIKGRRVKAAVFTTFSFDPGFFELHVLPSLFDYPFHHADKVKKLQLEDQLQKIEDVCVYFDSSALAQDGIPPQLDFRRIGVRLNSGGVFHPKLVFLLVEEEQDEDELEYELEHSLIVGTLSANLTRSGWWENVETGHFEEISEKAYTNEIFTYRDDVFEIVKRLRGFGDGAEQTAIEQIYNFLRYRTSVETKNWAYARGSGKYHPRIFYGQLGLVEWLEELKITRWADWNLEIISPFFDDHENGALSKLIAAVEPLKTRVFLPTAADGASLVSESVYQWVEEGKDVAWASLPSELRCRSNADSKRSVHAKIYRLWNKSSGHQVIISGSVNATSAAHSHAGAGNFEASFLVGVDKSDYPLRWWLKPLDWEPTEFPDLNESVEDERQDVFVDVSVRFDWSKEEAAYRVKGAGTEAFTICHNNGQLLHEVREPVCGEWTLLPKSVASQIQEMLAVTSFAMVKHDKGQWRVLVREESMAQKPSMLSELTPEEILMYWSLLSDAQRAAFIEERVISGGGGDLEGLSSRSFRYLANNTLFDRFSGIFHAFGRLSSHVLDCLDRGRLKEAEQRMFGSKYDSLPELLRKTIDENDDAVMRLVIFLSAQQAVNRVEEADPEFWENHALEAQQLMALLHKREAFLDAIDIKGDDREQFFSWYEEMFLAVIPKLEEVE